MNHDCVNVNSPAMFQSDGRLGRTAPPSRSRGLPMTYKMHFPPRSYHVSLHCSHQVHLNSRSQFMLVQIQILRADPRRLYTGAQSFQYLNNIAYSNHEIATYSFLCAARFNGNLVSSAS